MVVGAGEGRSLASLGQTRDILRCNVRLLVMRLSPIASVGTDQCAIFRIVATVIDYFSLLVTACHRVFTYPCLAPVLAGKNEHRLVLFAGKSEHHLDLVNTRIFTFTGHRSKYIRECAHVASVSVTNERTQPTVSIDICQHTGSHVSCLKRPIRFEPRTFLRLARKVASRPTFLGSGCGPQD